MHKLIDYICDELETLERKADKEGKLTMQEIQYMDTLAHAKKNLLTADAMEEEGYSGDYSYARGRTGNVKRDSMGRYSRETRDPYSRDYSRDGSKEDLRMELRELEREAKDDETRHMIKRWIKQLEE